MGNKQSSSDIEDLETVKTIKLFQDKEILNKKKTNSSFSTMMFKDNMKKKIIRSSINLDKLMSIGKEISNQIISTTINSDININLLSSSIVPDLTSLPNYQGENLITSNYKNILNNYNFLREEKSILHMKNMERIFNKNRKYFENEKDITLVKSLSGTGLNKTVKSNGKMNKSLDKSVTMNKKQMSNTTNIGLHSKNKSLNHKMNKSQEPRTRNASNDKFNKRLLYITPMKFVKKPKENEFNITINTVNSKNKNNQTITVVHKLDQGKLNEYYARKNKKNKKKRKLDMTFS
jgi:hypothetical protein